MAMNKPPLKVGDAITIQKTVAPNDTALKYGPGSLRELLGTARLVDIMIEASVKLIDQSLDEGFISVGKK